VLRDVNEVELTSSSFGSSRGIQTSIKDFVNRAISDIINAELNWPFTRAEGTLDLISGKQLYAFSTVSSSLKYVDYDTVFLQPKDYITNGDYEVDGSASITSWTTVSGTPAASSKFGNTLKLTSASATQEISDLIVGKSYEVIIKLTGTTITATIGTSSGGSETKSQTITISNANESSYTSFTFTATAVTHFITLTEASGSNAFIGFISLTEDDTNPKKLNYITYEEWNDNFREKDSASSVDKLGVPDFVYTSYNDEIGFSPIPDSDNLSIKFDYYITHTDLSASTDTSIIPPRFESVIVARARYYSFMLRSDLQNAQFANKEYEDGVKRMRVELINRKNYVRAV
tara:strand:+ start:514 stop:1548 length:1035 start_codon:yes stop_codon:yes gene_type:complete